MNRKTIPQADLYAVALSGGRDSAAAGIWALRHLPHSRLRFVFCDTQAELPEVYQYLDRYEAQLLVPAGLRLERLQTEGFAARLRRYGFFLPSPSARWCTQDLKIIPLLEWREGLDVNLVCWIVGGRIDEGRINQPQQQALAGRPQRWRIAGRSVVVNASTRITGPVALGDQVTVEIKHRQKKPPLAVAIRPGDDVPMVQASLFGEPRRPDRIVGSIEEVPETRFDLRFYPGLAEGWTLRDTRRVLDEAGIGESQAYKIKPRSGCFTCFFQSRAAWANLYRLHPDLFAIAEAWECEAIEYNNQLGASPYYTLSGTTLTQIREAAEAQLPLPGADPTDQEVEILDITSSTCDTFNLCH